MKIVNKFLAKKMMLKTLRELIPRISNWDEYRGVKFEVDRAYQDKLITVAQHEEMLDALNFIHSDLTQKEVDHNV